MHPKSVRRIFRFFPSLLKYSVYVENFAKKRYLEVKKSFLVQYAQITFR